MTYFITFVCYGCRLHGDEPGGVDRYHNLPGSPTLDVNPARASSARERMDQPPYSPDGVRREVVLAAIREVCVHREWILLASHVRTNHVHIVVDADEAPVRVMNDFKTYASRHLNRLGLDSPNRKRWARHGSTRWLWNPESVSAAIHYVVEEQGEAMAVFREPAWDRLLTRAVR